jgi:hypothetical protein
MTNNKLKEDFSAAMETFGSDVRHRLRRVFRGAVTLVEKYPHAYNAIMICNVLLSALFFFGCLHSSYPRGNTEESVLTPAGGQPGPLQAASLPDIGLLPLMDAGTWDTLLNCLKGATAGAEGDNGERIRGVLLQGAQVYGPPFVVLVLSAALLGLLADYLQKSEPTQLQLVEGVWCYSPTPASYRDRH